MSNDAAPGSVTPIHLTIFRGRPYRPYRIKSVTLEVSRDGGKSWHQVPLTGSGSDWLARVRDPATGFVALRTTVTDIKGNSTVETVDRAYGIAAPA